MRQLMILAALGVLAGCERVDYIELEPSHVTFKQASNDAYIEAKCMARTGLRAARAQVSWSVADESIATISAKGQLKPVKSGTTEFIARHGDVEARGQVTVIFVEKIEVEPKTLSIVEGTEAAHVKVRAFAADGREITDRTPVFSSEDKKVVQIVGGGGFLPLDPGTTTVGVQVDGIKTSIQVTVEAEKKK